MKRTLLARGTTIVAVAMIALAAYAAVEDFNLKRKPKVGDADAFKITAVFETDQGTVNLSQKRAEKVTEVKADGGFLIESITSETKISFGGQELPDQPEVKATVEMGPDGLAKTFTSDMPADASTYRIANLHGFKAPDGAVKIGDEIKYEIAADSKKGTPLVKSAYKVVGTEKIKDWDTIKLTFASEESGAETNSSIKGTIWINTIDGSLVKSEETWANVQPQGAPFPLNGKFTSERTK